jgi:RHS repeat-associated protein
VRAQAGSVDRFGFTGRELDAEFGMYHFRARTYDPKLGRFISQDPLSFSAGDLNLYRYVNNSPLNGVDPFGTTSIASYGVTLTPALMLLAAVSTQMYAENVLYFSTGRKGPLLTTLDAVVDTARDLSYLLVQGQSNARTFDFMKILLVRLVAIPTLLDHIAEPDVERLLPDGSIFATTTRVVPSTRGETRVDVIERSKRQCNPANPAEWKSWPEKIAVHSPPMCPKNGKSCFLNSSEAWQLSYEACLTGTPVAVPAGNAELRFRKCFPGRVVGHDGRTNAPRECVRCHIRLNDCRIHGYPVG